MANEVKWIRIATDIFDDEKMYAIETQQDGYLLELVWFKLLCLAGRCNENGFLTINNKLAYTNEMLAKVFRLDIGTVQRAIDLFQSLDMIEVVDNTYMISNWTKHQNNDGLEEIRAKGRERSQRYRDKQKQLKLEQKESNVTNDNRNVTDNVTMTAHRNVNCSYSNSISNSLSNSKDNNTNNTKDTKKNSNKNYIYYPNDEKLNQTFLDYMDMRKKIKSPMTDRAVTLAMNTLEKLSGGDNDKAIAILEQSIMNSWKGLFELKDSVYSSRTNNQQSQLERILNA